MTLKFTVVVVLSWRQAAGWTNSPPNTIFPKNDFVSSVYAINVLFWSTTSSKRADFIFSIKGGIACSTHSVGLTEQSLKEITIKEVYQFLFWRLKRNMATEMYRFICSYLPWPWTFTEPRMTRAMKSINFVIIDILTSNTIEHVFLWRQKLVF